MKKAVLYITAVLVIIHILLTENRKIEGTCDQVVPVRFRGINFQFPLKVHGILKAPMTKSTRYHSQLQTDSIGSQNITGKWFFEWDYGLERFQEITDTVKKQLVYGVAFELHEDSCKTDLEIIEELQKTYPGEYASYEEYGMKYYKWNSNCLTIFVKRIYKQGGVNVPEVSFCYGISDAQAYVYGLFTGYINGYPD